MWNTIPGQKDRRRMSQKEKENQFWSTLRGPKWLFFFSFFLWREKKKLSSNIYGLTSVRPDMRLKAVVVLVLLPTYSTDVRTCVATIWKTEKIMSVSVFSISMFVLGCVQSHQQGTSYSAVLQTWRGSVLVSTEMWAKNKMHRVAIKYYNLGFKRIQCTCRPVQLWPSFFLYFSSLAVLTKQRADIQV